MGFQKQEVSFYTNIQCCHLFVRLVVYYKITRILWVIKRPGIEQVQFVRERLLIETPDLPILLVCSFTQTSYPYVGCHSQEPYLSKLKLG